jgi:hypothetical protein
MIRTLLALPGVTATAFRNRSLHPNSLSRSPKSLEKGCCQNLYLEIASAYHRIFVRSA